ncbi:hypothetical protein AKJ09_05406 [Labilithrix luteola]|uniref:Mobile element protein n=1 Tax=Labilithrix luteola TaxID=1391654 RepID=A0A0K1PZ33_9BACT|nr:IS66 family insertion sequence element accessory protein TnpB [Labilithrix luteola]AKU98742.1 hypothetical protein AKJ09_05406 [Labilithrix luteola]
MRVGELVVVVREGCDVEHVGAFGRRALATDTRVLTLPPGVSVLVATARVDGRKGIDGLAAIVRSQFAEDPFSGSMYVFFTRRPFSFPATPQVRHPRRGYERSARAEHDVQRDQAVRAVRGTNTRFSGWWTPTKRARSNLMSPAHAACGHEPARLMCVTT